MSKKARTSRHCGGQGGGGGARAEMVQVQPEGVIRTQAHQALVGFLGLPKSIITNWVAENNRNVLSHSPGNRESRIEMAAGRQVHARGSRDASAPCLFHFLVFLS